MGLNMLSSVTLNEILDRTIDRLVEKNPDPNKPVVFKEDPIALSCASYRRAVETEMAVRFQELDHCVTQPEDYKMANNLRQYYRNKIAVKSLTSKQAVTKFYHDLYELLLGETELQHRHIGMLHRLPYFYAEDIARVELRKKIADSGVEPDWIHNSLAQFGGKKTHTLTPVMTIFRSRKGRESHEYWFQNETGQPVLWSVLHGNPLRSVIQSVFERNSITIQAFFYIGQVLGQDFHHYYVSDVGLKEIV
jgi:hypothetical protein